MFETLDAIIIIVHVKKLVQFSLSKKFNEALKRELDGLRKQFIQEKSYNVIEMNKHNWWKKYKTDIIVKQHLREFSPHKMPLRVEKLLENIKSGSLFGYVQCEFEVFENLREAIPIVHPTARTKMFLEITLVRL